MLYLSNTNFFNFRNLIPKKLDFDKKFNVFYGKNGQGKTSVLESIYFGVTGKSFRTSNIKNLIRYNSEDMAVYIKYIENDTDKNIAINYKNKKKDYYYNKKKVKYDEYFGKINIISFIPEDINMIMDSPGVRRSFFNYEISQANFFYYNKLKDFENILKVRNKLLKENKTKTEIFEIYNEKYKKISVDIMIIRREYIKKLSILLNLNYRRLFDNNKELKLSYISSIGEIDKLSEQEIYNILEKEILKNKGRELKYGFSMVGPQKIDFIFLLSGKESKSFSSEGEKRSVIFSLKIAEIDMIYKEKKTYPIFLIDDITSYFDKERQNKVLEYFYKRDIQVFVTSTEKLDIKSSIFYVQRGEVDEKSTNDV